MTPTMLWTLAASDLGCRSTDFYNIIDKNARYVGIEEFLVSRTTAMGLEYVHMDQNRVAAYVVWVCDSDLFSEHEKMDLLYYTTLDRIKRRA